MTVATDFQLGNNYSDKSMKLSTRHCENEESYVDSSIANTLPSLSEFAFYMDDHPAVQVAGS